LGEIDLARSEGVRGWWGRGHRKKQFAARNKGGDGPTVVPDSDIALPKKLKDRAKVEPQRQTSQWDPRKSARQGSEGRAGYEYRGHTIKSRKRKKREAISTARD